MQGTWENGNFVLASTKDDKLAKLESANKKLNNDFNIAMGALMVIRDLKSKTTNYAVARITAEHAIHRIESEIFDC